jgi:excisionase family DNA binding protein
MQVEDTRMYRVGEVAEHFNVSVSTIYRAIESGQLDALRLGTAVRVPGWAVLAYTDACYDAACTIMVTPSVPAVKEDALTPRQAGGFACVVCGAEFLSTGVSRRPVGRSVGGSPVFACTQHDTDDSRAGVAR